MSDLKKDVMDNIVEIKNTISNKEEAEKVLSHVDKIIDAFSTQLLEVAKRQTKLEERTEEVFELLSNIEEEMVQSMMADFVAECPYCGEDVAEEIPEDGSDFECPNCHNIIELEMMFDTCGCGCEDCDDDCDCGDCHEGCDCDDCGCNCDDECNCDSEDK